MLRVIDKRVMRCSYSTISTTEAVGLMIRVYIVPLHGARGRSMRSLRWMVNLTTRSHLLLNAGQATIWPAYRATQARVVIHT